MIHRDEITSFLAEYLACGSFNDYAPNGLQIEGKSTIQRICTAVTASEDVIQQAIKLKCDALFVHHGYFWRGEDSVITGMRRQRIAEILRHDLNLYAYHLPLDCHHEIGNNACIGQLLGVEDVVLHMAGKAPNLLWSGHFPALISPEKLSKKLTDLFMRKPLQLGGSNKPIKLIAWCSGAAQDFIEDAHRIGADAYISGEVSERTFYQAKELGIHYFSCGHHATERFGIQALGTLLSQRMGFTHHFLDSDNPV